MTERQRKAGKLQSLTLITFLAAGLVGTWAAILGIWVPVFACGLLMMATGYLYQVQSAIIEDEITKVR